MRRLWGLILFSIGIGMTIMFFLPEDICVVFVIIFLLMLGYHLFCG